MRMMNTPYLSGYPLAFCAWLATTWLGRKFICPRLAKDAGLLTLRTKNFEDAPKFTPLYQIVGSPDRKTPEEYHFSDRAERECRDNAEENGFQFNSCRDFHNAYHSGKTTPVKVAEHFLQSVLDSETGSPPLQPISKYDREDIMNQAKASTKRYIDGRPLGPLDGIPVVVKGDIDVKGYETNVGTDFINAGNPAVADAEVVRRLRAAGALIFGKTRMHELGFDVTNNNPREGTPRNPYNEDHYTGGSSGGSACAVASGLCPIAVGDDGGGSVRIPASHCGVFGLKPTFGRISLTGSYPLGYTVGHIGPIAANAEDLALAYSVMAGPDNQDTATLVPPPVNLSGIRDTSSLSGLRIGFYSAWMDIASLEIKAACRQFLRSLADRGATLIEIVIEELDETRVAHTITIGTEITSCSRRFGGDVKKLALPIQMNFAVIESGLISVDYLQAQQVRARTTRHLEKIFQKVDILVTPTTGLTAPKIHPRALMFGESDMSTSSRVMAYIYHGNFCGVPAVTCPAGYDKEGLPIGIQFMASWYREELLLRMANVSEEVLERHRKKPRTWYGNYEL